MQLVQTSKRTGWVRCNVKGPESIADHMYRMGMMSLIAGNAGVNMDRYSSLSPCHAVACQGYGADVRRMRRCIRLSIVHDVAEGQ